MSDIGAMFIGNSETKQLHGRKRSYERGGLANPRFQRTRVRARPGVLL
jgi:hypothetical protein